MVIFKIVNSPTALQIDRSSLGPKTAPGLVERESVPIGCVISGKFSAHC